MVPPDRLESRIEARGTMRDGSPTPSADTKTRRKRKFNISITHYEM